MIWNLGLIVVTNFYMEPSQENSAETAQNAPESTIVENVVVDTNLVDNVVPEPVQDEITQ